jgi:predicted nucleic-acid-binding protein
MIGIDTNIIIRYLMQDDPAMGARATHIVDELLSEREPGFVSVLAVAEVVWTLRRTYRVSREKIASVIESLLASPSLVIEREQEVFLAMLALKDGAGEFADALIGALGTRAGCSHTLTFDRAAAARLPGFRLA